MHHHSLRGRRRWPAVLLLAIAPHLSSCSRSATAAEIPTEPIWDPNSVHVTTFGDSNTDIAWTENPPRIRARSYVSDQGPRLKPTAPNHPAQLAGLIEQRWRATQTLPIHVVNHAIAGTTTGGGGHGGLDRTGNGAPNARTVVDGVTRFEGEVLGRAFPWSGGERRGSAYNSGAIRRVNAYVPGPRDFAYISLGTNDLGDPSVTVANLAWMVEQWTAAGHEANHLVLTTLPPHLDRADQTEVIPAINAGVRALAARTGVGLIDLSAYVSADDGRSWRSESLHVGDRLHYTTAVRAWIADQMVAYMAAHQEAPATSRSTTSRLPGAVAARPATARAQLTEWTRRGAACTLCCGAGA